MEANKRTPQYDEEITVNIPDDVYIHSDDITFVQAKKIKYLTLVDDIKSRTVGYFIRSVNSKYADALGNLLLSAADVGALPTSTRTISTVEIDKLLNVPDDTNSSLQALTDGVAENKANIDTNSTLLLGKKDKTGFNNQDDVTVTYSEATKQITLTNVTGACYNGVVVPELIEGWVSSALPSASPTGGWYLSYGASGFVFSASKWSFNDIQIAFVFYDVNGVFITATREPHGEEQSVDSHEEFHNLFGTYVKDVPTLTNWTADSTTASERRPFIPETILQDEDLATINEALLTNNYTLMSMTGTGDSTFLKDQTDIFTSANAQSAYWNEFNGTTWQQSIFTNNQRGSIWVFAVPCSADTNSQKARFIFVQGQSIFSSSGSDVENIKDLDFRSLNLGDWGEISPEFNCIAHIIIKETGAGYWAIDNIIKQTVTKAGQGSQSGNFLSAVNSDPTYFDGAGTATNELTLEASVASKIDNLSDDQSGITVNNVSLDEAANNYPVDTLSTADRVSLDSVGDKVDKAANLSLAKTNASGELEQADKQLFNLTGFSSFTNYVIPLISLDNTITSYESYAFGTFELHRNSGYNAISILGNIGVQKKFSAEEALGNLTISASVDESIFSIKVCTFTYNNIKYCGLHVYAKAATSTILELDLFTNSSFIDYINTYNNDTDTILNSEIYNSLIIEGTDVEPTDIEYTLGGLQINSLPSAPSLETTSTGLIQAGTAKQDQDPPTNVLALADTDKIQMANNEYSYWSLITGTMRTYLDGFYATISNLALKLSKDFTELDELTELTDAHIFSIWSTASNKNWKVTISALQTKLKSYLDGFFVPLTRTVNSKALSSNITLDNTDVNALADNMYTFLDTDRTSNQFIKVASISSTADVVMVDACGINNGVSGSPDDINRITATVTKDDSDNAIVLTNCNSNDNVTLNLRVLKISTNDHEIWVSTASKVRINITASKNGVPIAKDTYSVNTSLPTYDTIEYAFLDEGSKGKFCAGSLTTTSVKSAPSLETDANGLITAGVAKANASDLDSKTDFYEFVESAIGSGGKTDAITVPTGGSFLLAINDSLAGVEYLGLLSYYLGSGQNISITSIASNGFGVSFNDNTSTTFKVTNTTTTTRIYNITLTQVGKLNFA